MDNISHSLVGLAVGQAATRLCATRSQAQAEKLRVPLLLTSLVGANFPDIDFLYVGITPGKLGYFLHHRGHSHTLIAAIPEAFFVLLLIKAFLSRFKFSKTDWAWLGATALLGPALHIGMDYWNSYGVHPFWPFDSRWRYGDMIFILEPWIWVTLLPFLIYESISIVTKVFFSILFATAIGLCAFAGYVPWQMVLVVTLWGLSILSLVRKCGSGARIFLTTAALACLLILFSTVSQQVKIDLTQWIHERFPRSEIQDIALTPLPANPFCWNVHTLELSDEHYITRQGTVAAFSRFLGAAQCPKIHKLRSTSTSIPLIPVPAPPRPEVLWTGQFEAPLRELHELINQSCTARAFLRFSRIPIWAKTTDGAVILKDSRFDFTEVRIEKNEKCPDHVPNWTTPFITQQLFDK